MSPTMSARWAGAFKALLLGALVALVGPPEPASAQVLLEGGEVGVVLQGNDFQCGLRSDAGTCAALDDSPTDPGGAWPTGSPNAYMFNSGIMIATVLEEGDFSWAGDTVGAFFFNASGPGIARPITNVWNSLDPEDFANWPEAGDIPEFPWLSAYIEREDLYDDVLIGRKAASQQDSWLVYWDGDPSLTTGRPHPAGLLVEQRTLAWNYPAGNEGTLYFVYEVTNVSDNAYFQQLQRARFPGVDLPEEGWTLENVYMAYAADPDVTADARANFASAILPFDMGIVWQSTFEAPEFQYPPSIFHPPFYLDAPGIIGTKYLRSPLNLGLTLFSVYTNGGAFSDPAGSAQLLRYLSGDIRPELGDGLCTIENVQERRLCYFNASQTDVRYFQSSGPFSIEPGETVTIVSAMFAAATVNAPGSVVQGETNPEVVSTEPEASPSLHPGCYQDPITPILIAAGWVSLDPADCPPEGETLDIFDVVVVDESLLHKAQVAQTIFDNEFLLPFAPEPPAFYVVPGDGEVTVVWEPSPSEQEGDPFFQVAGDETSPLFNPNFRQFDVEGYRVYRSQDNVNFQLLAQFDKAGTFLLDFTCETDPEFVVGEECPIDEDDPVRVPLSGRVVQFPPGGVVELADGSLIVMEADTAPAPGLPELRDTGVPFVYVDENVRNGFEYYYQVTAFDINSLAAGPSSLESTSLPAKAVVPQPSAAGFVGADSVEADVNLVLGDGTVVEPTDNQTIDPATGVFSGAPPPTDALGGFFEAVVPQLLSAGGAAQTVMTLDSVIPAYYAGTYYFSDDVGQIYTIGPVTAPNTADGLEEPAGPTTLASDPAAVDSLEELGEVVPPVAGQVFVTMDYPNTAQWHSGDADWAYLVPAFWTHVPPAEAVAGGSRWFDANTFPVPDPTIGLQHGALTNVSEIFQPLPYHGMAAYQGFGSDLMRRFFQITWAARRVADVEFQWGAAGEAPEVFDVTHQLAVPFSTHARASYGFVTDADGDGVITFGDFWRIPGLNGVDWSGLADTPLEEAPVLMDVDTDGDLVADGTGFAVYIAGEPYIFQTDAIPTNTTWTFRTHSGVVAAPGAGGPYVHLQPTNEPEGVDLMRTPGVPGLRFSAQVTRADVFFEELVNLENVRVAPDPYYGASLYDFSPAARNLRFLNLPAQATIRIYSTSGVLVDVINHNSNTGESLATWDLKNRSGQMVASGVYFYHLTTPEGKEHTGKFTVVHSGLSR